MGNLWPIALSADLTPLCQVIADILQSGHKGVCKLAEAFLGRVVNEKVRSSLLTAAQNEADAKAIMEGKKIYDAGILMDIVEPDKGGSVLQFVALRSQIDEARCLMLALKDVAKKLGEMREEDISDDPIPRTFFNRWRKEAELIDDDELRDLWSRVLVEETCRPGSIALQTIEVIRRLSKDEAATFQKILKGSINSIIPKGGKGHVQYGTYADILALQDVGLIQTAGMTTKAFKGDADILGRHSCSVIRFSDCPWVFVADGAFNVECYTLSGAGKDISRIALIPRQQNEILSTAEYLVKTARLKEEVSVHLALPMGKNSIQILPNKLWSSKDVPTVNQQGQTPLTQ